MRLEDNWGHLSVSAGGMCAGAVAQDVGQRLCLSPAPAFAGPQQSPDVLFPNLGHSSTRAGAEQAPLTMG